MLSVPKDYIASTVFEWNMSMEHYWNHTDSGNISTNSVNLPTMIPGLRGDKSTINRLSC